MDSIEPQGSNNQSQVFGIGPMNSSFCVLVKYIPTF